MTTTEVRTRSEDTYLNFLSKILLELLTAHVLRDMLYVTDRVCGSRDNVHGAKIDEIWKPDRFLDG